MASENTTVTSSANTDLLLEVFRQAVLLKHNGHRADHGSPPLKLNSKLNEYAQEWAETCAGMEDCVHRSEPAYNVGENLHAMYWGNSTADEIATGVVDDFYNEIFSYDFRRPGFSEDSAHFTQLVWYDTTDIGVGIAMGESSRIYCVVNYTPQGNMKDGFRLNVLKINTKYEPRPELTDQTIFVPPTVTRVDSISYLNLFRELLTNQHNIYRKHYCVPFLQNVNYLNNIAQKWAEYCAEHDKLVQSQNIYGENLSVYLSGKKTDYYPSVREICRSFMEEEVDYNYDDDTEHVALHFTQMIWKSSKEIGIGIKKSSSGKVYVVCMYNPPGNISGEYKKNVFRFKPINTGPIKVKVSS